MGFECFGGCSDRSVVKFLLGHHIYHLLQLEVVPLSVKLQSVLLKMGEHHACVHAQSGAVMPAEQAAEQIAAATMQRPRPPREIVTGARARTALAAGYCQKWLWPAFVERKFASMFGLDKLERST